jgi:hypothetical protein
MSQHIGPRTISAQGGSIKRVGPYRIHTFPSELVTDGLVLNLDAGDPRSYPSSGTTWTDLSGNGNNGTLVNGPTYSNADGGFIDFVSTSAVRVPISSTLQSGYYTIDLWIKFDSFSSPIIFSNHYQANGTISGIVISTNASGVLTYQTRHNNVCCQTYTNNTLSTNTWYNLTFSYDGSKIVVYTNGVAVNTISATGTHQNINDFYLANNSDQIAGGDYTSNNLDGKISIFRYYNRALSAAEVAQNYDALRVRYGTYTNTFTPICAGGEGKVEVLCVAGGGGGGVYFGGGGGAGGLIYNSGFGVNTNSSVNITVGSGGRGGFSNSDLTTYLAGTVGGNSTFSSLTAFGGGTGNGYDTGGTLNGGSGGGGRIYNGAGGTGVAGQGYAGAIGTDNPNRVGGGGGGAGGPGQSFGIGGNGLTYSISGTSATYAGGGAGNGDSKGVAGFGGAGNAGPSGVYNAGGNAVPNTGSGGGGSSTQAGSQGGTGSNGTVIVRYPATDYNVEVLVVAGGGGGGRESVQPNNYGGAGGGGGGGLIYVSSIPVSSGKKYLIDVGAGGAGSTTNAVNGANGKNSKFEGLVAIGGGGGGGWKQTGSSGGSGGGGGSSDNTTTYYGGSGTPGQGNDGGYNWFVFNIYSMGGGGGGAGGPGATEPPAVAAAGMAGGAGLSYSISGTSVTYAAGGRGSYGETTTALGGVSGSANTGNGGGGGSYRNGGNGGSGVVIIAYKGPQRGIGGTIDTTSRPGYTLHIFTTTGSDIFIP